MLSQSAQIGIIFGVVVALFVHSFVLSRRLDDAHRKLDHVLGSFNGLRNYLYEIDPQFNDERELDEDADSGEPMAGYDHLKLIERKESEGRRTLNTRFFDGSA